jgi:hypothetical protein
MSVASTVFNRSSLKLVAALAIPTSIIYFFYYSQQQANIEVQKYKQEQKANPLTQQLVVDNYTMKEVDGTNHERWKLTSESGQFMPNGQDVVLKKVKVEFFDTDGSLKMRLCAPSGMANQSTKFVRLDGEGGERVQAEGQGGKSRFECQHVELKTKNRFVATGGVIIDWSGVAKVRGDSASGSINLSAGPKDMRIVGNTHAQIVVK